MHIRHIGFYSGAITEPDMTDIAYMWSEKRFHRIKISSTKIL